jgi:hypothetical protein
MQILILTAVLAAPQFEVQTLDGQFVAGNIVSLDARQVVVQEGAVEKKLEVKDLIGVTSKSPVEKQIRPTVVVQLTDGSRILGLGFQSADGAVKVASGNDSPYELPVKALRWVRFVESANESDRLDNQWTDIVATDTAADLLVVRKKGAIDSTDGVVGDVSDETIAFTFDGDRIDVKRSKVEGIVFARPAAQELPNSICTITTGHGSRYDASTVELDGDKIVIATPAGLKTNVPVDDVVHIDFSAGKRLFLSDLDPEAFHYEPYFAPQQPIASLNDFYRLRRDIGLENAPLKLDGRVYRKGIALHSRSVVSYRLPGKFRMFKAVVGIDDGVRNAGGNVLVEIKGDGKSLWKESVRHADGAKPLELDVSGVKRLEIVADFGEGQDVADHLDLCDAQVTK